MAFRRSDLQEAFFVAGTHPFRVWGYGTTDPLEEVLASDYFGVARGLLRAGELIYISTYPPERQGSRAEPGEPRMALVMVQPEERGAGLSVRLVQDFGRPRDCPGMPELRASPTSEGRAGGAGQARPRPASRQPEQKAGRKFAGPIKRRARPRVVSLGRPARRRIFRISGYFSWPARISEAAVKSHDVRFCGFVCAHRHQKRSNVHNWRIAAANDQAPFSGNFRG